MARRVCYLARDSFGDRLTRVRLIGSRTADHWPGATPPGAERPQISEGDAAAWIAQRLQAGASGSQDAATLSHLVLDVQGARCAWISSSSPNREAVQAALALGKGASDASFATQSTQWATPTNDEAGLQSLAIAEAPPKESLSARFKKAATPPPKRLAVLTVPDVPARLLVDALDDVGINADQVISLWHAISVVWDPASPLGASDTSAAASSRVVATASVVSGLIVVDPEAERVVWVWSSDGKCIAAGSLRSDQAGANDGLMARLVADWLAWSLHMGCGPNRIRCVVPPAAERTRDSRQTPGDLYRVLQRNWPGAPVEVLTFDDPIDETLRRLADDEPLEGKSIDPRRALVDLSQRASRAHRSLYRAIALTLLAGAVALSGVAWKLWQASQKRRSETQASYKAMIESVQTAFPGPPGAAPTNVFIFNQELMKLRERGQAPKGIKALRPVLPQLDAIASVIGSVAQSNTGVQLESISLTTARPRVQVVVPDTPSAEEIVEAMNSIAGNTAEWRLIYEPGGDPARRRYKLDGEWPRDDVKPNPNAPRVENERP